jgi:hypothetical protein
MSLQLKLTALAQAVGDDVQILLAQDGNLAALTTTAKNSLVAAINELVTTISGLSGGGAGINDAAGDGDTAVTWSADKIYDELLALKNSILNGVDPAYDTLVEIATKLGSDDTAITGLLDAVSKRVRYDAAQSLTTPQQAQACANIGVGDPETDLVTIYTTARDS